MIGCGARLKENGIGTINHKANEPVIDHMTDFETDVATRQGSYIGGLNESGAGKEFILDEPMTAIGRPCIQVAAVTQFERGYFIVHIEDDAFPSLNASSIVQIPVYLSPFTNAQ